MNEHTKGPWEVGESDTHGVRVRVATPREHAQARQIGVPMEIKDRIALCFECSAGAAEANAKLIAAAPDLVQELEDAADMFHEIALECLHCNYGDGATGKASDGSVCEECAPTREAERRAREVVAKARGEQP